MAGPSASAAAALHPKTSHATAAIPAATVAARAPPPTPPALISRFPPEPSFPIDLGHVKAALCVDAFATRHNGNGSWILRFDDTNPRACPAGTGGRVAAAVASYLRELPLILPRGRRPCLVSFASDYFADMHMAAEALIAAGLAYVDEDAPEELRRRRRAGEASPWRGRPAAESSEAWERMLRGEPCCGGGTETHFGVLRLAFPDAPDDPNVAMRDPVAFRVVLPPEEEDEGGDSGEQQQQERRALHWRWDPQERATLARLCSWPPTEAAEDERKEGGAADADGNNNDAEENDDANAPPPPPIPLPPSAVLPPSYPPNPPLVFPTYDFACPFLDLREAVPYALRTREFRDRDAQHARVQTLLLQAAAAAAAEEAAPPPPWLPTRPPPTTTPTTPPTTVLEFSKILFPGVPLDKPSLRALALAAHPALVQGPSDPRLPTLAGLLRWGCSARALRRVLLEQALPEGREAPKGAAGGAWAKLWSINRAVVGLRAPRHMAVVVGAEGEEAVVVELEGAGEAAAAAGAPPPLLPLGPGDFATVPLPKGGHTMRVLRAPAEVRLSREDAALLSPGDIFTLLGLGAATVLSSGGGRMRARLLGSLSSPDAASSAAARTAPKKFAWVPGPHYDHLGGAVPIRVLTFGCPYPEHLAAAKPVLASASAALASPRSADAGQGEPTSPAAGVEAVVRAFDARGSLREARGWADAALAELAAAADSQGRCAGSDARLALAAAGG